MSEANRIRVLQFLNSSARSGAEEVALELARRLDSKKFKSYLVCPPKLLADFGNDWKLTGDASAYPLYVEKPWHLRAAMGLVAYLRSQHIDIVHAHMIRAAVIAVPLARMAGVPVVLHTCHGREAWRKGWVKRRFWIDRKVTDWSDATIAVSEATRDYLLREKGLDPQKIFVIRNGRTINGFSLDNSRREELLKELRVGVADLVISVFGRLDDQKGHRFLIQALPQVLALYPGLKVLFVGEGPLRKELELAVAAHQIGRYITFTGYRRDWADLMAITDIVVLPSLYEGLPLVPIEAATFGKPVVATAVDGTCEVIVDGLTGRLVPPCQPEPLARALIEILGDRDRRLQLGERARSRVKEMFSLEHHLAETEALYEHLFAKANGRLRAEGSM